MFIWLHTASSLHHHVILPYCKLILCFWTFIDNKQKQVFITLLVNHLFQQKLRDYFTADKWTTFCINWFLLNAINTLRIRQYLRRVHVSFLCRVNLCINEGGDHIVCLLSLCPRPTKFCIKPGPIILIISVWKKHVFPSKLWEIRNFYKSFSVKKYLRIVLPSLRKL